MKQIEMFNSVPSAGTKDDSSNVADVTTSAPIMPNPMLAAGLSVLKFFTKRNIFFTFFLMLIIQNLFSNPNYTFYILLFILGIYFEICDLVDLSKEKLNIRIDNNVNNNIINETGIPLNIQDIKN